MSYIQQGDTLYHKQEIPKDAKKCALPGGVVQHGEATGHAHRLYGDGYNYFETPQKERFLRVVQPTELRHEEHHTITLTPGDYRIGIVREYDHFEEESREVVD